METMMAEVFPSTESVRQQTHRDPEEAYQALVEHPELLHMLANRAALYAVNSMDSLLFCPPTETCHQVLAVKQRWLEGTASRNELQAARLKIDTLRKDPTVTYACDDEEWLVQAVGIFYATTLRGISINAETLDDARQVAFDTDLAGGLVSYVNGVAHRGLTTRQRARGRRFVRELTRFVNSGLNCVYGALGTHPERCANASIQEIVTHDQSRWRLVCYAEHVTEAVTPVRSKGSLPVIDRVRNYNGAAARTWLSDCAQQLAISAA